MKEIYRSFEGRLDCTNQAGYIVYRSDNWVEVESLSIHTDVSSTRYRFRPDDFPDDPSDLLAIGELQDAVDCGRITGQVLYRGKWRVPSKIIDQYKDYNWRKYCQ